MQTTNPTPQVPQQPQPTPQVHEQAGKKSGGKIIIAIVIVLVLLAGGYFAYQKLSKTDEAETDTVAIETESLDLLPPEFDKYAVGEDANGFIIIRNDEELTNLWEKLADPEPGVETPDLGAFKNGLILIKAGEEEGIKAILQFETEEDAEKAINGYNEYFGNTSGIFGSREGESDVSTEGNFLIFTFAEETISFNGSLYDNPLLEDVDQTLLDAQIIVYLDEKMSSILINAMLGASLADAMPYAQSVASNNYRGFSIFPTAHAQFLTDSDRSTVLGTATEEERIPVERIMISALSTSKSIGIFIKVSENDLKITLEDRFMEVEDVLKWMEEEGVEATEEDLEDYKEGSAQGMRDLEKALPEIESTINTNFPKNTNTEATLEDRKFTLNVSVSIEDLLEFIDNTGEEIELADIKGRDATRITDLQKIQKGLVVYDLENTSYFPRIGGQIIASLETGFEAPDDTWGTAFAGELGGELPIGTYFYTSFADGYGFALSGIVEGVESANADCKDDNANIKAGILGDPTEPGAIPCYVIFRGATTPDSSAKENNKLAR